MELFSSTPLAQLAEAARAVKVAQHLPKMGRRNFR